MPERIQRKRTAGWRQPAGVVFVGRGTVWGNPYRVGRPWRGYQAAADAAHAVALFRALVDLSPTFVEQVRGELAGRDLMCWCRPGQPCHADVLIEIANPPPLVMSSVTEYARHDRQGG